MARTGADLVPFNTARSGMFQKRSNQDLLERIEVDAISVIHAHGLSETLAAKALADAANLPLMMTCHDIPEAGGFFAKRTSRKHLAGRPIIAVSDFLGDLLKSYFDLTDEEVVVIPTGLDLDEFHEERVSSERTIALAEKWGVIEDPRPIVLVPDASQSRDWLDYIARAAIAGPDALWIILGDEIDESFDIPAPLALPGAAGRIRWISRCDDLRAAFKLSSVVLSVPDLPVATCDVALEAQAMGRPVIISDTGAGPESLQEGKTGWLTPVADATALGANVATAIALDESAREHVSSAARGFIQSRFSTDQMQNTVLQVYRQVAGG